MRVKRAVFNLLTLLFLNFFLSGCSIAYRSVISQPITEIPIEKQKERSITIIFGSQSDFTVDELIKYRDPLVRAYRDSNLFTEVKTGFTEADLRAEINIEQQDTVRWGIPILSNILLNIIPYSMKYTLSITTTVTDTNGNILQIFQNSEDIHEVNNLLFIFALGFPSTTSVFDEALYDLGRMTIHQAHEQGIL